jgi:predicted DNA-binding transcriptional regulator AlpA
MKVSEMQYLTYAQLREHGITFSLQHLRRLWTAGKFPKPVRFGVGEKARLSWPKSDIDGFKEQRLAERDQPRPRNAGGNVVPIRRGRRSHYGEVPRADPPSRPRYTAEVGPKIILSRPVR